jgi:hypothetical protein
MMCDRCALSRGLAEGEPGNCKPVGTVEGVQVGASPTYTEHLPRTLRIRSSRCSQAGTHPDGPSAGSGRCRGKRLRQSYLDAWRRPLAEPTIAAQASAGGR